MDWRRTLALWRKLPPQHRRPRRRSTRPTTTPISPSITYTVEEESFVWVYRRGGGGKELNTSNVGVENYFYGQPGDGSLDELITDLENEYSNFVNELRSTASDGPIRDDRIPKLVSHLSLRTRSLRAWAQDSFVFLTERLQHALKDEQLLRKVAYSESFRDKVRSSIAEKGLNSNTLEWALDSQLPVLIEQIIPSMAANVDELATAQKVRMPQIMAIGHNDALLRHLEANQRTETYANLKWFVLTVQAPLILGDIVSVFETAGQRRFKPLDDKDEIIRRIYLPISSHRLLLGTPFAMHPEVSSMSINKASARCSYEFFISSTELPKGSSLVRGLGQWSGLMNVHEMNQLLDSLKAELPQLFDSIL